MRRRLRAEPLAGGLVAHPDADLHAAGPQRVAVVEEDQRIVEPLRPAPGPRGRDPLGIRMDHHPQGLRRRRCPAGSIGPRGPGTRGQGAARVAAPAQAASSSRRVERHGGYPTFNKALEHGVPGRPIRALEPAHGLGVVAIVSRAGSQRSLRPSRSDRLARWQAVTTRWLLSRSEIGVRRDLTQSRKLRTWRRNWSYSSPESSRTASVQYAGASAAGSDGCGTARRPGAPR